MGQKLALQHSIVNDLFSQADQILGKDISSLCWHGPAERLNQTDNAQPAIFTLSVACYQMLRERGMQPEVVAGHSVGEYAALYAAGAFDFETGIRILRRRGDLMMQAAKESPGGMMAVLGLPMQEMRQIADEIPKEWVVDVAAYNSPRQIVVSGNAEDLATASDFFKQRGAKRVIPLRVTGAFHSRLQEQAREAMKSFLQEQQILAPQVKYVANYSGQYESDPDRIREMLCQQLTSPVRWLESMETLNGSGIERYIECGGKVLAAFIRASLPQAKVMSVFDQETLEAVGQ